MICISFKCDKVKIKEKIVTMVIPFVSLYLWHTHCKYVFLDGSMTKHAMTIQNYESVFSQKTGEDIDYIWASVWKFSFGGRELCYIVLFIIIVGMMTFLADTGIRKKYVKIVLTCIIVYITYMAGTACMYIFSMPLDEAKTLASISRYRSTIFIAIYYILVLFSLKILSSIEIKEKQRICLVAMFVGIVFIRGREDAMLFPTIFTNIATKQRTQLEQIIKDNDVTVGTSCVICVPEEANPGYIQYLGRYLLFTDEVSARVISEKSQLYDAGSYDCILIYDTENETIQEWVRENYPQQEGKSVILTTG